MNHNRSGYSKGCRCDECTKAQRDYMREWQRAQRGRAADKDCAACGKTFTPHGSGDKYRFCSRGCQLVAFRRSRGILPRTPAAPREPSTYVETRSPLRTGIESGNPSAVLDAIRSDCTITPSGCWEWSRTIDSKGYPRVNVGGRTVSVHRLSLEAKMGASLGSQPAHHICANAKCCNPDHLTPVTHAANVAEMMARRYMERRIRDLEAALHEVAPTHPALSEISVTSDDHAA